MGIGLCTGARRVCPAQAHFTLPVYTWEMDSTVEIKVEDRGVTETYFLGKAILDIRDFLDGQIHDTVCRNAPVV